MLSWITHQITFGHKLLLGHVDYINPAIDLNNTLRDWVDIEKPWIDGLDVFTVSELEAFITLLNGDVRVAAAAAKTANEWTPGLETAEDVAAELLGGLYAGLVVVTGDILEGRVGVHYGRWSLESLVRFLQNKYYKLRNK